MTDLIESERGLTISLAESPLSFVDSSEAFNFAESISIDERKPLEMLSSINRTKLRYSY